MGRLLRRGVLLIAAGALIATMAACAHFDDATADLGSITAQASGKFSGGSIFSGSVNGIFEAVGLGNVEKEPYLVQMQVEGLVWFSCINKGGNEAPGQLSFTLGDEGEPLPVNDDEGAGRNGKYETGTLTVDITDPANLSCERNKNWNVKTWGDTDVDPADWPTGTLPGDAVTYLEPTAVSGLLFEATEDGGILVPVGAAVDELSWTCNTPDPTYPLEEYDYLSVAPLSEVCTLD